MIWLNHVKCVICIENIWMCKSALASPSTPPNETRIWSIRLLFFLLQFLLYMLLLDAWCAKSEQSQFKCIAQRFKQKMMIITIIRLQWVTGIYVRKRRWRSCEDDVFVILFYAIYGKSCVDIDDFTKKASGRLNTIAHGFYNTVLYIQSTLWFYYILKICNAMLLHSRIHTYTHNRSHTPIEFPVMLRAVQLFLFLNGRDRGQPVICNLQSYSRLTVQ